MADETLLTAGNSTEGSGPNATGTAEASAPATTPEGSNTETQPTPEAKPEGEAKDGKPQEGAPEAYEYKLPEGFEVDQELKGEYDAVAKEFGLSNDKAQKFVDLGAKLVKLTQDRLMEAMTAQKEKWLADTKADKEIGGGKLDEVSQSVSLLVSEYGTPELKAALNETELGNHPELIRFAYRIERALKLKEGKIVTGGNGASSQKDAAQILFGSTSNGQQ